MPRRGGREGSRLYWGRGNKKIGRGPTTEVRKLTKGISFSGIACIEVDREIGGPVSTEAGVNKVCTEDNIPSQDLLVKGIFLRETGETDQLFRKKEEARTQVLGSSKHSLAIYGVGKEKKEGGYARKEWLLRRPEKRTICYISYTHNQKKELPLK